MKDKSHSPLLQAACRFFPRFKVQPWCWALALLLVAACAPKPVPPPPPPQWASRVITQDGLAFAVHRFRFPGKTQEITIRAGGAKQWMPLNLVQTIRFTGSVQDRYRPAEITLISGERLRGEVFVGSLVEGTTDLGYWNMPFSKVDRLEMGTD